MPASPLAVERSLRAVWTGRKEIALADADGDPITERVAVEFSQPAAGSVHNVDEVQFAPFTETRSLVVTQAIVYDGTRELGSLPLDAFPVMARLQPRFEPGVLMVKGT